MVIGFMILYNYVYRTFNYKRGEKQKGAQIQKRGIKGEKSRKEPKSRKEVVRNTILWEPYVFYLSCLLYPRCLS